MIKRIIFDLDNTLIMWKDEYISALKDACSKFNVSCDYIEVDKVVEDIDDNYPVISKEILLHEINNRCNLNLNMDFIDYYLNRQKTLATREEDIVDTLEYLSKKYELVVLTNWFTDVQKGRLEAASILKYFKEVIGGEDGIKKPNIDFFKKAMGSFKAEECLAIGDNINKDIVPALKLGMNVILMDRLNKVKEEKLYPVTKEFKKLKEML